MNAEILSGPFRHGVRADGREGRCNRPGCPGSHAYAFDNAHPIYSSDGALKHYSACRRADCKIAR